MSLCIQRTRAGLRVDVVGGARPAGCNNLPGVIKLYLRCAVEVDYFAARDIARLDPEGDTLNGTQVTGVDKVTCAVE